MYTGGARLTIFTPMKTTMLMRRRRIVPYTRMLLNRFCGFPVMGLKREICGRMYVWGTERRQYQCIVIRPISQHHHH